MSFAEVEHFQKHTVCNDLSSVTEPKTNVTTQNYTATPKLFSSCMKAILKGVSNYLGEANEETQAILMGVSNYLDHANVISHPVGLLVFSHSHKKRKGPNQHATYKCVIGPRAQTHTTHQHRHTQQRPQPQAPKRHGPRQEHGPKRDQQTHTETLHKVHIHVVWCRAPTASSLSKSARQKRGGHTTRMNSMLPTRPRQIQTDP